jgi:glucokinase
MILVGDVGGTKTRLALYKRQGGRMQRHDKADFASANYSGLEEIVSAYLQKHQVTVKKASFGIPGPVINGEAKTTNLPWVISEKNLAKRTSIKKVKLVNDLVAVTTAIPHLSPAELTILYDGTQPKNSDSNCAVLAPGTGLGEAFLYYHGGEYHVHASEGGHVDFAPNSEIEIELLRYLQTKFERVSYERVLCGPGLVNIYEFLNQSRRATEPPELRVRLQKEDAAAVIANAGQNGEFAICVQALDIFVSILGAQAGNLVLTMLTTGGVYLGGGIPPKISKKLSDGTILKSYFNKGRLRPLVEKTSLYIIKDDHAALLGAAHIAVKL